MFMILYYKMLKTVLLVIIMMTMAKIQLLLTIAMVQVIDQTIMQKVINTNMSYCLNFDISNLMQYRSIELFYHSITATN